MEVKMPIAKMRSVAAPSLTSRSCGNLIRGLSAGAIDPSSISPVEQAGLRSYGKMVLKRARAKVIAALKVGRTRIARREQRVLLGHPAIRIFVAYLAIQKVRRRSGSRGG